MAQLKYITLRRGPTVQTEMYMQNVSWSYSVILSLIS